MTTSLLIRTMKTKRSITLLSLLCLQLSLGASSYYNKVDSLSSHTSSQKAIGGVVKGSQAKPLAGVYIEVYALGDSLMPKASTMSLMDGRFSIPEIEGISHIIFQHLGYETLTLYPPFREGLVVELSESRKALDEVVVQARRPMARLTAEGFSFAPNLKELKLRSVEDYIARLPFVSGSGNSYEVFGRGKATIYINNRPMRDAQELKDLNMEDILGVEVITQPGAGYAADVPAVIKVRTKPLRLYSIGGDLRLGTSYDEAWRHWEGASFNLSTPNLSLKVRYMNRHATSMNRSQIDQTMKRQNPMEIVYNSSGRDKNRNQNLHGELIYTPNSYHSMGVQYIYTDLQWRAELENKITTEEAGQRNTLSQKTLVIGPSYSNLWNAFYKYEADKLSLLANIDYYLGKSTRNQDNDKEEGGSRDQIDTRSHQKNHLLYAQMQVGYKIGRLKWNLGADWSQTRVGQTYGISQSNLGLNPIDLQTDQDRLAAYLELAISLDKWQISSGMRYETLKIDRKDKLAGKEYRLLSQGRLYPSLSLMYKASPKMQVQMSYKFYTQYPSYSSLRSSISYSSPYLYEGGNPDLLPEKIHNLSLVARYKSWQAMIDYKMIHDDIHQLPELFSRDVIVYRPHNTGVNRYLSLGVNYRKDWSKAFDTRFGANVSGAWFNVPRVYDTDGWRGFLSCNNTYQISKAWQLYANISYSTGGYSSLYKVDPSWQMHMGCGFTPWDGKLSIHLDVRDVFSSARYYRQIDSEDVRIARLQDVETRVFSLQVRYRLQGKFKEKSYAGSGRDAEISRF